MSKPIHAAGGPARERLQVRVARRLLPSRVAWRLTRAIMGRRTALRPHDRVASDFFLGLGEHSYAGRSTLVISSSIFVPSELMWGLGLVPFFPETAAGLGAGLGLSSMGVEGSAALSYPVDLCTFNRSAAGLKAAGFFPRADAYVTSSNLCDVTGQMLANSAHAQGRPFTLLDVPQSDDETAVAYLAAQLQALVERWRAELRVPFDPETMRRAIRRSNQARALALEVAALREAHPAPLRGSSTVGHLGILTSIFGHPAGVAYYGALRDYTRERIERAEPEQANQKVRLYWMHLRPFFSTELMPHLEDDLGAVIAFEELSSVWWEELDEAQPLRSLALKMLTMHLNGPVERRVDLALRHIDRYRCAGAVHFGHWGCRQSTGALRVVQRRLRRAGVPLLTLDGDCVDPTNLQLGPLRTRVEAYVEMLTA